MDGFLNSNIKAVCNKYCGLKRACRASQCIHTHWTKSACCTLLSLGASKDLDKI